MPVGKAEQPAQSVTELGGDLCHSWAQDKHRYENISSAASTQITGRNHCKGSREQIEIILNYINSCFTQSSKCGWVQWSHHKKINIYAHTGSGNLLRMAQVQHDSPNEEIMKAKSFQPKNRGPGDSYDPI